jgi:hypothetical protein
MSVPVRQTSEPARWRLSLLPGVATSACRPRGIQQEPNLGFRRMSISSWNTAASSGGSAASKSRILRSFAACSESTGPNTGRGRR